MKSKEISLIILMLLVGSVVFAQRSWRPEWKDHSLWRYEIQNPQRSYVNITGDTLEIASLGGATVWLTTSLKGDYIMTYDRKICQDTGVYDRVSDLNQFWLAHEPEGKDMINARNGAFEMYDDLRLFYFGIGGNYNTTTRFRKYDGQGNRTLLDERNQEKYLLQPNIFYRIKTIVSPSKGYTAVYVDDELWFLHRGEIPDAGYFGFRLTYSRQQIMNISITRI